jgi:hypothetical protein
MPYSRFISAWQGVLSSKICNVVKLTSMGLCAGTMAF